MYFFCLSIQKKTILLTKPFVWWNMQNSAECLVGCPQFADKCVFVDGDNKIPNTANLSAVIHSGYSMERPAFVDPEKVFAFYFILESNFVTKVTLKYRTDILTSYWRGSGLITPYGKWAYYDPSVTRQKQGN